jgi:hypothetical protein
MERPDTPPRLEPQVPRAVPHREPALSAPSLSIGRLYVEVVNPPIAPPAPLEQPRVIIQNIASRHGRIPSRGRFGLGQV